MAEAKIKVEVTGEQLDEKLSEFRKFVQGQVDGVRAELKTLRGEFDTLVGKVRESHEDNVAARARTVERLDSLESSVGQLRETCNRVGRSFLLEGGETEETVEELVEGKPTPRDVQGV